MKMVLLVQGELNPRLTTALSPIRRLPVEIFSEIFLFCTLGSRPNMLRVTEPPWSLGAVCRHWREVALSTPELWSVIFVNLKDRRGTLPHDDEAAAIFLAETYLQRSGQYPLHISVHYNENWDRHPIFEILISHSNRWQHVDLYLPFHRLPCLNGARNNFAQLRKLGIFSLGTDPPPLNAFEIAPQLHEVWIGHYPNMPALLTLPWSQLIRYRIDFGTTEDILKILRQMLNVVVCHLTPRGVSPPLDPNLALQLSQLRSLSLLGLTCDILDHLTLPALEKIMVRSSNDNLINSLTSLIFRSSCSLKTLIFIGSPINFNPTRILQQSPSLVELRLGASISALPKEFFLELTYRPFEKPCSAPRLLSITFEGATELNHNDDGNYRLFVDMIESRFPEYLGGKDPLGPVARLQHVSLKYCAQLDPHDNLRLQRFRDRGLNITELTG